MTDLISGTLLLVAFAAQAVAVVVTFGGGSQGTSPAPTDRSGGR